MATPSMTLGDVWYAWFKKTNWRVDSERLTRVRVAECGGGKVTLAPVTPKHVYLKPDASVYMRQPCAKDFCQNHESFCE